MDSEDLYEKLFAALEPVSGEEARDAALAQLRAVTKANLEKYISVLALRGLAQLPLLPGNVRPIRSRLTRSAESALPDLERNLLTGITKLGEIDASLKPLAGDLAKELVPTAPAKAR